MNPCLKESYQEYKKKTTEFVPTATREIPQGQPNCLMGLTFVFTGDLSSISRDAAGDLVKRYGG